MDLRVLPPIIVDENGDLEVYRDVEDACSALEAIDVLDGVYVAYDSRGYPLSIETSGSIATGMSISPGTTPRPDDLVRRLRHFVESVGSDRVGVDSVESVSLEHLLAALLRFFNRSDG